jgi:hypothetical protein
VHTRLLIAGLGVSLLLSATAIGLIAWMNADPQYWFPSAYANKGPTGDRGPRGTRGPVGPQGPAGPSGDVALEARVSSLESDVSDLQSTVGNNTSSDDLATRLDNLEGIVGDGGSLTSDLSTTLSGLCDSFTTSSIGELNDAALANC